MNTLTVSFIRVIQRDGQMVVLSLPGVLAALMRDDIVSFVALRPHQRHAWHAFLAQLGTLALLQAGLAAPPLDEATWCALLRGLTPDDADDAPWCLVSPPGRPALLQAPLPDGDPSVLKGFVLTPDSLDMLIASKNHDLKDGVMTEAGADAWLFALVTLQTMEGFLGAGNYGISRMNGGFANRPALGLAPPGGPGAHLRRDIVRLLAMGGRPPLSHGYAGTDGLALVWLPAWDGAGTLPTSALHPLYIEICRRVRLVDTGHGIAARVAGSKAARIAPTPGGVTGDPWTPIRRTKDGQKALTVDSRGFGYRPLVELMFPEHGDTAPLQNAAEDDMADGLVLVARALVRGQGKTEGYHERRVPLSRMVRRRSVELATDPLADMARTRVALAGEMARVLRFALFVLFENGPAKVDIKNDAAERKMRPFLARFERAVDLGFFEALWREAEAGEDDAAVQRAAWVKGLLDQAAALLKEADASGSKASHRRFRARVGAEAALHGGARRNERLAGHLEAQETPSAD